MSVCLGKGDWLMRWILVFIILYLIPLIVLFKNYKNFRRVCIYGCTYIVLATTIVISNMYISGVKTLENDNNFMAMNYRDSYVSTLDTNNVNDDLCKIKQFKRDITDIEDIAMDPIRKCGVYAKDINKYINDLNNVKKDVEKAKYMCERVIEIYDEMKVPNLSKEEYTQVLDECVRYMKEAYELKYKSIELIYKVIDEKNITYIPEIKDYIKQSDDKINQYKRQISELEENIKNNK